MKKLIFMLVLIVFIASCAVINPIYTERRTRALQSVSSGWYGWYGWYNPYQLYGYYNQYKPYYWNSYQTGIASTTKTTITKRQLQKGAQVGKTRSVSNTTRRVIHRESLVSRGTARTVVTKSSKKKK